MWCGNRYILYLQHFFFLHRPNFFLWLLWKQEPVFLFGNSPMVSELHVHCDVIIIIPQLLPTNDLHWHSRCKSYKAKFELYGWGNKFQPCFFKASLVHKVVCSPALWCKDTLHFLLQSESWYMLVWGLCRVAMYTWKLNFFLSPQISITIISLIYQKTDAISYPADRAVLNFFSYGHIVCCNGLLFNSWLKLVNP